MSKTQHQRQPNQPSCHSGKKKIDIFFWGSLFFVSVLFILAFIDTRSQPWLTTLSFSVYHMVYSIWWGYSDLNREALRHRILNPACLPISPYPRKRARFPHKHHVDIGTNSQQQIYTYITSILFKVKDILQAKL